MGVLPSVLLVLAGGVPLCPTLPPPGGASRTTPARSKGRTAASTHPRFWLAEQNGHINGYCPADSLALSLPSGSWQPEDSSPNHGCFLLSVRRSGGVQALTFRTRKARPLVPSVGGRLRYPPRSKVAPYHLADIRLPTQRHGSCRPNSVPFPALVEPRAAGFALPDPPGLSRPPRQAKIGRSRGPRPGQPTFSGGGANSA